MGTVTHKSIDGAFQAFADHLHDLWPGKHRLTWKTPENTGRLTPTGDSIHLTATVIKQAKQFSLRLFSVSVEDGKACAKFTFDSPES